MNKIVRTFTINIGSVERITLSIPIQIISVKFKNIVIRICHSASKTWRMFLEGRALHNLFLKNPNQKQAKKEKLLTLVGDVKLNEPIRVGVVGGVTSLLRLNDCIFLPNGVSF